MEGEEAEGARRLEVQALVHLDAAHAVNVRGRLLRRGDERVRVQKSDGVDRRRRENFVKKLVLEPVKDGQVAAEAAEGEVARLGRVGKRVGRVAVQGQREALVTRLHVRRRENVGLREVDLGRPGVKGSGIILTVRR